MSTIDYESARRQARVLLLLASADRAGLSPIGILALHGFAFLSNVLSPVWEMPPLSGRLLKRRGGPFYPELQRDLDRMVGTGLITISTVSHVRDDTGAWRLEGEYRLNANLSKRPVEFLLSPHGEVRAAGFALELAYAMTALNDSELAHALVEDATYCDPSVSADNVIDFGEWASLNPSAGAAAAFDEYLPKGTRTTPGERLHLYVRHLHRRASDGR